MLDLLFTYSQKMFELPISEKKIALFQHSFFSYSFPRSISLAYSLMLRYYVGYRIAKLS